jgi:hypothetical protein
MNELLFATLALITGLTVWGACTLVGRLIEDAETAHQTIADIQQPREEKP